MAHHALRTSEPLAVECLQEVLCHENEVAQRRPNEVISLTSPTLWPFAKSQIVWK
jgi:hypothetical protein